MQYVDVQGARVPALGLGTWQLSGLECRRTVQAALELGYRHIDTAQTYANEGDIGIALQQSGIDRGELWLTTKVAPSNLRYADVVRSTRDSIRRLATDYVDLLLVHWPNPDVSMNETLAALQHLQEQGAVRYFGLSNFTVSMVEAALQSAPLFAIQVECHPFLPQKRMLSLAAGRELLFTAYSPLAQGELADDETLQEIGASHGKTPSQVALRWLLQRPNTAAIPKASSSEHLRENLQIFDFELSREQVARIDALGDHPKRILDPPFAPQWET